MRNFIAAVWFAAFASAFAHADDSYGPPEVNNTERALPDVVQTQPAESESADSEHSGAGDSAQPDGESTSDEQADSQAPRELDV